MDGILAWDSRRGGTHARESSKCSFDNVRFGGLLGEDPADDVQHTKMCGSGVVQPDEAFYSVLVVNEPSDDGVVLGQTPASETMAAPGATVTLTVGTLGSTP